MSHKTQKRLEKIADLLEKLAVKFLQELVEGIATVLIDLVWGKAKYRKRTAQVRPIVHRTYNRTVVYRVPMTPRIPNPKVRTYIVK